MSSEKQPGDPASSEPFACFRRRLNYRVGQSRGPGRPRKHPKKMEEDNDEPRIRAPLERQRALLAAALRLWELRQRVLGE